MKARYALLGCFLLFSTLVWPAIGWPQEEDVSRVVGVGSAEIGTESRSVASHNAFDLAMQDALMQVIRQRVAESALAAAQPQIQEKILSRPNSYVRNYQTLEEKVQGGNVTVRVAADVWVESVRKDLTALGVVQLAGAAQDRTVQLIVKQPDRYRKVVALRKYLQEEAAAVGRVATLELTKKQVTLEVTLKKDGSPEQLRRDLAAKSFDGRTPKVTRVADDQLEVDL